MGVSRFKQISFSILILVIVGIAVVLYMRSTDTTGLSADDYKFADVFIEMALAREIAGNDLDSLDVLYKDIFEKYDVDSIWLQDFISTVSYDAERHKLIWDIIIEKLDSLKANPEPDSS